MIDKLGDRIKKNYEDRTRTLLPRRTYTLIRIDGKAFHTYTRGLKRPFDSDLMLDMDTTAAYLCKNIMGAKMAYVQSDEISLVLTDFDNIGSQAWFDNNVQKMASISASMATASFNALRLSRVIQSPEIDSFKHKNGLPVSKMFDDVKSDMLNDLGKQSMAMFDARVFQIPELTEVCNYFIWRQQDATRNSISSVAQSLYSHKELEGKSSDEKQEMIFQKGINWNDYTYREKRGGVIAKAYYVDGVKSDVIFFGDNNTAYMRIMDANNQIDLIEVGKDAVIRSKWERIETPIFTQNTLFLKELIPLNL
jgi:tRNA(His) guanylyltransferase